MPMGGVTRYEYHASGQPSKITDPVGAVTTFGYDADSRTQWMQDAVHQGDAGTDVRSFRTYYDFDEFGRVVRQSAPKSTVSDRGTLVWSVTEQDPNDNVALEVHPGLRRRLRRARRPEHAEDRRRLRQDGPGRQQHRARWRRRRR